MTTQRDECATCGEVISEADAEVNLAGGGIGFAPQHATCRSMPESLKAKISRCPICAHMTGRHLEVTAFNESTGKIQTKPSQCSCGCDYYLKPRGVG